MEILWSTCAAKGMLQVGKCSAPGKVQAAVRMREKMTGRANLKKEQSHFWCKTQSLQVGAEE